MASAAEPDGTPRAFVFSTPQPADNLSQDRRADHWVGLTLNLVYAEGVRSLGLDVGTKTIGIALSDALGLAAHPLLVLPRCGTRADVAAIDTLAEKHEAEAVIVGLPLELSGKVGHRARRVQVLIDALGQHFGDRLPVYDWDERFSTCAVERVLIEADLSRAKRKKVIDKQAAAYILQGWLDANRPSR